MVSQGCVPTGDARRQISKLKSYRIFYSYLSLTVLDVTQYIYALNQYEEFQQGVTMVFDLFKMSLACLYSLACCD